MTRPEFLLRVETLAARVREDRPFDRLDALIQETKTAAENVQLPIPLSVEKRKEVDKDGKVVKYSPLIGGWLDDYARTEFTDVRMITYARVFDPYTNAGEDFDVEDYFVDESDPNAQVREGNFTDAEKKTNRETVAERLEQFAVYYRDHPQPVGATGGNTEDTKPAKSKRGRKREYDPKEDRQIVNLWRSGEYPDYEECAVAASVNGKTYTRRDIELALQRDRGRKRRKD